MVSRGAGLPEAIQLNDVDCPSSIVTVLGVKLEIAGLPDEKRKIIKEFNRNVLVHDFRFETFTNMAHMTVKPIIGTIDRYYHKSSVWLTKCRPNFSCFDYSSTR